MNTNSRCRREWMGAKHEPIYQNRSLLTLLLAQNCATIHCNNKDEANIRHTLISMLPKKGKSNLTKICKTVAVVQWHFSLRLTEYGTSVPSQCILLVHIVFVCVLFILKRFKTKQFLFFKRYFNFIREIKIKSTPTLPQFYIPTFRLKRNTPTQKTHSNSHVQT